MTAETQDFNREISREVAALENLFSRESDNLFNSASIQGKPWYGIALESNEVAVQKDATNKKGLIVRMVEAIKTFIKKICDRVRKFFARFNEKRIQKQAKAMEGYRGVSESEINMVASNMLQKALKTHTPNAAVEDRAEAFTTPTFGDESFAHVMRRLHELDSTAPTKEAIIESIEQQKLKKIQSLVGEQGIAHIATALQDEFFREFFKARDVSMKLSAVPCSVYRVSDTISEYEKLNDRLQGLKILIDEAGSDHTTATNLKKVEELIAGKAYGASKKMAVYLGLMDDMNYVSHFLFTLSMDLSKLTASGHEEDHQLVKNCQRAVTLMSQLSAFFVTMFSSISTATEVIVSSGSV